YYYQYQQQQQQQDTVLHVLYSHELDKCNLKLKIGCLEGCQPNGLAATPESALEDALLNFHGDSPYVTLELHSEGRRLTLPRQTQRAVVGKLAGDRRGPYSWNEWLAVPAAIASLPRDACLCLTIWDVYGTCRRRPIGGSCVSVFSKRGQMRRGMYELVVWPGQVAEPGVTPGKVGKTSYPELSRLLKVRKRYSEGSINKIDWQDQLALKDLEVRIVAEKRRRGGLMFLNVTFQKFLLDSLEHSVVYFERDAHRLLPQTGPADLVVCPDPDINAANLSEEKHHAIERGVSRGAFDRERKPNAVERDCLHAIMAYPPHREISMEERDLVWKYRYYLSRYKRALGKFLRCIDFTRPAEVQQALGLIRHWQALDSAEALELLSPDFPHPAVRHYAVSRLAKSPMDELLLYLPQLVQALRYEYQQPAAAASQPPIGGPASSRKQHQQQQQQEQSSSADSSSISSQQQQAFDATTSQKSATSNSSSSAVEHLLTEALAEDEGPISYRRHAGAASDEPLTNFLIDHCCKRQGGRLAQLFYWYLTVEAEDAGEGEKFFGQVRNRLLQRLKNGNLDQRSLALDLKRQDRFVARLATILSAVNSERGDRLKKEELLRVRLDEEFPSAAAHAPRDSASASPTSAVASSGGKTVAEQQQQQHQAKLAKQTFFPFQFMLDPSCRAVGLDSRSAGLFKSSRMPARIKFLLEPAPQQQQQQQQQKSPPRSSKTYTTIFKYGDDLRQDQLVMQMIELMDRLLRQENVDLRLTPYRVLATGREQGFVQCINSVPLSSVQTSVLNYLRQCGSSPASPYGVKPEVLENYVRSCAGYCIVTYLLGVGDRHLDNLMLTRDGRLFHIDFGFILGRDPKVMPPPMKLTDGMVAAMGGQDSQEFIAFLKHCDTAYKSLRRHASVIVNLFSLMLDSSVPEIAMEPDKTLKKLTDRFCLHLTDEEATQHIVKVIQDSLSAFMPQLIDTLHDWTQAMKR
ncbi:hypothetical protein BOX15_Mlig034317g1, partial [Macrostomum lignano]